MKSFPLDLCVRAALAMALLGTVLATGVFGYSPWNILPLGLAFTVLYFLGRQGLAAMWQLHGWRGFARAVPVTWLTQTMLCTVVYLLGRGLASILGRSAAQPFQWQDLWLPCLLLLVGVTTTALLLRVRRAPVAQSSAPAPHEPTSDGYAMEWDAAPVTVENFYTGKYFGHDNEGDEVTTPEMIAEAQQRLGITLPPLLRQLYERQNGGMAEDLWVPACADPSSDYKDWRGAFAAGYNYLTPLQKLGTVHDSYLYSMTEEEIAADSSIPVHAKRYIVLVQRYFDTTFLDYSAPGEPRVGIVDFDGINSADVWFDTFEDFFRALRRGWIE